jgi:tRNA threonylcarbamoyladenosine biosynthesis protein TsaB
VRVLGIETSTPVISVAVVEENRLLGEVTFSTKQAHMERLLPLIDYLLNGLELRLEDLDGFAVAVGPGSFTSLRVGLATGQAFAHALGKPLIGVPTLDALAWALKGVPHLICPVLSARFQEVYAAFYLSTENEVKRLSSYLVLNPVELCTCLQEELRARITFTGEGAQQYWALFQKTLGERAALAEPSQNWPRAGFVAALGMSTLLAGEEKVPRAVEPLYVRPPAIRRD